MAHNEKLARLWGSMPKNERPRQQAIADALGITQGLFSRYLNGDQKMDFDKCLKLAPLMGVHVGHIWDGDLMDGMRSLTIRQIQDHLNGVDPDVLDQLEGRLRQHLLDDLQ